jgi:hypothetical protein
MNKIQILNLLMLKTYLHKKTKLFFITLHPKDLAIEI